MPANPANQITVYLDPAQIPSRLLQDQQAFDNLWAALLANLPTFGAQFNAGIANFNAAAAGSAYAIPYTIDLSSTADTDPGSGKLRFDSATQNAAATLRLDLIGSNLADYTAMIDTFDSSTSTVKGQIRIVKLGDATKFLMFDVTARTAPTGYRDISVTPRASSSANPFVASDAVLLFFQRTGDKGNNGATNLIAQATVSSAVANIDFLNAFSSAYDRYTIEIEGVAGAATNNALQIRFANGGTVDSSTAYGQGGAGTSPTINATQAAFGNAIQAVGLNMTIEVRNANSTGLKSASYRGSMADIGGTLYSIGSEIVYNKAATVSGFRLLWSLGTNFTAGTVRVYGHTNT